MKKLNNRGFTLIELMVVIVIIGILVAIALPNFVAAQDRAKASSVKANIHSFQLMLEIYGVDNNGVYPNLMADLASQATSKNYLKVYKNPFTGISLDINASTPGNNLAELITGSDAPVSFSSNAVYTGSGGVLCAGQVIYRRPLASDGFTKYTLYGLSKDATFLQDKNNILVISND